MKRFIPFFLILVMLVSFASVSQAPSLDAIEISGTEFTLLSNTDQCLSNCEAWIEWDLTKGILANVQLPAEKTSQFKFDLVKENIRTQNLNDFGIEVWEEKGTLIQDYRLEDEIYEASLIELKGLDANQQGYTCEDFHCTEKEKDVCNCIRKISVPNGSHTDYAWELEANSFYGFEAVKDKIYRLRIWGNRDAKIGSNSIDWIPTFFGEKITEWAWWNASWESKFAINSMILPVDLNANSWVKLEKVNFNNLSSACADAADVTIVNENTQVEVTDLNFQGWNGTSTDADVNILFKLTAALANDTYNGEYYIYSNNAACAAKTNDTMAQGSFDGFENNNYTTAPKWNPTTETDLVLTVSAAAKKEGSYGLSSVQGGSGQLVLENHNMGGTIAKPYRFCSWFYMTDVSKQNQFILYSGGTQTMKIGIIATDFFAYAGGANYTAWATTPVNSTWYYYCGKNDGQGSVTFEIYDATKSFLESEELSEDRTGIIDEINLLTDFAGTFYWDDITFETTHDQLASAYTLGAEETNVTGDLNFTTIDGVSYKTKPVFAYGLDGNITIDFNIYREDNNRTSIDLNYSTSVVEGSGTVIAKDLNLVASICPDQDWDDTPSQCSYSWNYSNADDGNYAIIGSIATGADFNASDGNFTIANDVNLRVNIPIDESTGAIIDFIKYYYIVKVLNDGIETTYSVNTDVNYFGIPISEEITVLIDTNVDAAYWGREYFLLYETATLTDTIQPYLAPVGSSVLTTIHTVTNTTLTAIPDMRIKVYKDLPGGRTLINESVTDGKGETAVAFVISDNYELEVYNGTTLLFEENYVATSTTNNHYIYLPEEGSIDTPTIQNVSVRYLPAMRERTSKDFNISIIVASNNDAIVSARINLINNGIVVFDSGIDTGIAADGNTYIINVNDLPGLDTKYTLDANVVIVLTDGSIIISKENSWRFYFIGIAEDSPLWLLTNGMRRDFGCQYNSDTALGTTCQPLFLIAIFIIFFGIGGLALSSIRNATALAIMSIIMTSFFVYITWIPFVWGVLMAVTGIVIIISKSRVGI